MTARTEPSRPLQAPRRFAGRVLSVDAITQDTRIVKVAVEGGRVPFMAGQYAMLHPKRGEGAESIQPRAFSIASAPHLDYIEFHVKSTGRGISNNIFEEWQPGAEVAFDAPFGEHYWRPSTRPLLALAGGVGIAPVKAIVEAHLDHAPQSPSHVYWGVRDKNHLYLDRFFRTLAEAHAHFHYVPLLAAASDDAKLRTGFIGPALQKDFPTLKGHNIYMAGPAAMVEATLPLLLKNGAEKEFIFSDAFGP